MPEHYFSADPSVPFERESFTAELWGSTLTFDTGSGVFSRGHLDHATAVLFRELEPPVQGQFLDLGCGYGVIGLAIASAVPLASVIGVDVNERALLLANDNARAAGVASRFVACLPDQVPSDQVFDEIWSNPPIRIGKEALRGLLLTWLLDRYEFIRIPGEVYFIDRLPVAFEWGDIAVILLLSMFISFVATIYPARQAARLYPLDAIRHD